MQRALIEIFQLQYKAKPLLAVVELDHKLFITSYHKHASLTCPAFKPS